MIEQNYNQIWHRIKANIYIIVNHNFTMFICYVHHLHLFNIDTLLFAYTVWYSICLRNGDHSLEDQFIWQGGYLTLFHLVVKLIDINALNVVAGIA